MTAPRKTRAQQIVEMAQAYLSNGTIAGRLGIRAKSVRITLSRARSAGSDIPHNQDRIAHERAREGLQVSPLSEAEIGRLEIAAIARGVTSRDVLDRMVRACLDPGAFPMLLDNVLDDEVTTPHTPAKIRVARDA